MTIPGVYLGAALALAQFARHYRKTVRVAKDGTVTPFENLSEEPTSRSS